MQIVWEAQKRHQNFNSSSGFLVIDQNIQNMVVINNPRTPWPTKILIPFFFLSSLKICFQMLKIIFKKQCW